MTVLAPLAAAFPLRPLKFVAPLSGEKVDSVPFAAEYIGLEQLQSWTGRLSGIELEQQPEGGANTFSKGDVLFGKLRPYLAKAWVADRDGYSTPEAFVMRPVGADPRYVRYCLLTPEFVSAVDRSTYGAKMPRADWSFVGALKLPFPPPSDQERIANFLDEQTARIDELIAEKERLLDRLAEYRQSTATSAVTRGLPGTRTGFVRHPFLGEIPRSWRTGRFRHYVEIRSGQINPEDDRYIGMTLIAPNHVESGTGRLLELETAAQQSAESGKYWCDAGDVIYSKIRPALRKATCAPFDCLCSADMYPLKAHGGLTNKYLLRYLLSEPFSVFAAQESMRVAMPKVNRETLADAVVPLPPLEEQKAVVAYIEAVAARVDAAADHVRTHVARLREYRSSLISAAVTGQLRP